MEKMKQILVDLGVWKRLSYLKVEHDFRTIDDAVNFVLESSSDEIKEIWKKHEDK